MKNKNKLTAANFSFIKVPANLLTLGLSANALYVILVMIDGLEGFNPSTKYLMQRTSMSRPTLRKAILELLACNVIIKIAPARKGHVTKYALNDPENYRRKNV